MPTFYNFRENGLDYSFDDIFVPADLFREGTLWTWGSNSYGRLGTNDTTNRSTPVTTFAGGTNWKQVSCQLAHTAAIKTDGTLWTWGIGSNGRLGTNEQINRSTPTTTFAGGNNWKQVDCGANHTVAIKTDGTLWVWGSNTRGELGTNSISSTFTPATTFTGGTNWKQISVGVRFSIAIKTDGTLWTWGANTYGQLATNDTTDRSTPVTTFAGGSNWKQVNAGNYHSTAIKTDGTLWTWGENSYNQLGINNTGDRITPVTTFAGGTNWKQVDGGFPQSAAIKTDGTLWTWGNNTYGGLGNASVINSSTPVTTFAGGNNWKQVSSGYSTVYAIKTDGTLWSWGIGTDGRLGNGIINGTISTPITTFAGGTNWKQVISGDLFSGAVTYEDPAI